MHTIANKGCFTCQAHPTTALGVISKIEKCPRVILGEKSRKDSKFGKTGLNNWSISKSQKQGTEPGVRKG